MEIFLLTKTQHNRALQSTCLQPQNSRRQVKSTGSRPTSDYILQKAHMQIGQNIYISSIFMFCKQSSAEEKNLTNYNFQEQPKPDTYLHL